MQKYLSLENVMDFEKRTRVQLINSLGGFKSMGLIGSIDNHANTNLSIFSSFFHIGATPPLMGVIFRFESEDRHSLSNIIETGFYTINHVNECIYKQAHQTSARYPKDVSEFYITGLTTEYKNEFKAPFVKESNVQLGLEFKQRIDLEINNTVLIIGQISQIYFPADCLCQDGYLDIEKANTMTCSGLDSYHKTERVDRLSYAKPNLETSSVKLDYIE